MKTDSSSSTTTTVAVSKRQTTALLCIKAMQREQMQATSSLRCSSSACVTARRKSRSRGEHGRGKGEDSLCGVALVHLSAMNHICHPYHRTSTSTIATNTNTAATTTTTSGGILRVGDIEGHQLKDINHVYQYQAVTIRVITLL